MRYILITLIFTSCNGEPLYTSQTNNEEFQVEKLFTYDSITVYRFKDGTRSHYFTKNETMSLQSCGKNCIYNENIESRP